MSCSRIPRESTHHSSGVQCVLFSRFLDVAHELGHILQCLNKIPTETYSTIEAPKGEMAVYLVSWVSFRVHSLFFMKLCLAVMAQITCIEVVSIQTSTIVKVYPITLIWEYIVDDY
jgi:hypothetical protein